MRTVHHAVVLNLHQPAGNLEHLLERNEWEAKEILFALDNIPRSLWPYEDVARVHLSLSGTLLETLSSPAFQERVYGIVKCGDLLWHLQNQKIISILGTGYYHPVMPLIPEDDWDDHLGRWMGVAQHLFWRKNFSGFWPPEMGFTMEMIPHLKRFGYDYVIVDSEHIEAITPMRWEELRYRPHVACFGGAEITVIVRDRDLSNAQQAGMDEGWFMSEVHQRTRHCDFDPLVTTCTDGENGGWFRNVSGKGNFWGTFYQPLLEWVRRGDTEVRSVFIEDYLHHYRPHGEVRVRTGAWNTGWHHGVNFIQWTGSGQQQEALRRARETSAAMQAVRRRTEQAGRRNHAFDREFEEARWRLLRAETSCNFFWGEAWVERCHRDLDEAWQHLHTAENMAHQNF